MLDGILPIAECESRRLDGSLVGREPPLKVNIVPAPQDRCNQTHINYKHTISCLVNASDNSLWTVNLPLNTASSQQKQSKSLASPINSSSLIRTEIDPYIHIGTATSVLCLHKVVNTFKLYASIIIMCVSMIFVHMHVRRTNMCTTPCLIMCCIYRGI